MAEGQAAKGGMTMSGRFELKVDEDTGRRYWWGAEDGWKDATEIGKDGLLTLHVDAFQPGTVLVFTEPETRDDEGDT